MPRIKTRDGTSLYVKDWGEGRSVILTHGWPLGADMWDAQAMALADAGFRVVFYDRRGFARSDQPWTGYDYDTFADDLADVMQETGANEDAVIIGFSMGGGEIARYMSRHGGKGVRAAGLISSVVPYMLKTPDNPDGTPKESFDSIAEGIQTDRAQFFYETFFPDFFGKKASKEILAMTTGTALHAGLKPTLAAAKAFGTTDFRPDLPAFSVPTLIIHGTKDKTVPIDASARAAHKGIAGSELIEYEGAPHGLNVTDGDRLTQDLLAFVQR